MNCKEGSIRILDQIKGIIHALDTTEYTQSLELFSGSTVGKHIRHIYDFYNSINYIENGHLDYAQRVRDPQIENNPGYASLAFDALKDKIEKLDPHESVMVMTDFDIAHDDCQACVGTTIGRELMYAYDHAVHHLAIVKMGIKTHYPNVTLDKTIGIASSTLNYQQEHQNG